MKDERDFAAQVQDALALDHEAGGFEGQNVVITGGVLSMTVKVTVLSL